jgi:hypothetical protein
MPFHDLNPDDQPRQATLPTRARRGFTRRSRSRLGARTGFATLAVLLSLASTRVDQAIAAPLRQATKNPGRQLNSTHEAVRLKVSAQTVTIDGPVDSAADSVAAASVGSVAPTSTVGGSTTTVPAPEPTSPKSVAPKSVASKSDTKNDGSGTPRTPTSLVGAHSKYPHYSGRVQRDANGNWIVDGAVVGLASINIPAGQDASFDTSFPAGLVPIEMRGHYVVPTTPLESWLEIGIAGVTPERVRSNSDRTFVASLQNSDGTADSYIEFAARSKINSTCVIYLPSQIDAVSLVASGELNPPSTLADFFPPYLDRLIVRIDGVDSSDAISTEVAEAVLRVTTYAVQHWPSARVVVSDKPIPMTPYDRQIVLRVASKGAVSLEKTVDGVTSMILAGPKARFSALVETLGSATFETAFVRTLKTNGTNVSVPELLHTVTLGDLRGKALTAKGYGSVEQIVTVTQSQLGGQTASIAITASGVAQVAGSGRVVVQLRANDQVLASKRVSNDEPFSLKGVISRSTLSRDNVIVVRASELVTRSPAADKIVIGTDGTAQASCAPAAPEVTLQLDPGSQFAASMGRGLPAGFDRFPQAFVPGFDVRFTSLGVGELQAATNVVELLQSLSAPRLLPKVFGPGQAHTPKRPMIYIGSPTPELTKLNAPIVPEAHPAKGVAPISVLQGFAATGDDHLVLVTNGPASDLAATLKSVLSDPRGWRSLRGDVVVRQSGRVRNVRVRSSNGNGEEKPRVILHSRIWHAVRVGFVMGLGIAMFGGLLSRLFGRKH